MPRKTPMFPSPRPAALAAALLAAALLAGCQTSRELMHRLSGPTPAAQAPSPPSAAGEDLALVGRALDATAAGRAGMLDAAHTAYQSQSGPREALQYALLLATTDPPSSDLTQAQSLLTGLLADAPPALKPDERNLARLELVLITRQLTLETENRTLHATGAQKLVDLEHQLRSAAQQNVSLRRQLGEARAKLAAITNIEKSLNEGKLGNGTTPP